VFINGILIAMIGSLGHVLPEDCAITHTFFH